MGRNNGGFTLAELKRMIKAADGRRVVLRKANGDTVEIGGTPANDNGAGDDGKNPWDTVLGHDNGKTKPKRTS